MVYTVVRLVPDPLHKSFLHENGRPFYTNKVCVLLSLRFIVR